MLKIAKQDETRNEAVWLFIAGVAAGYVTWSDAQDAEFREILGICQDETVAQIRIRRWGHPEVSQWRRDQLKRYRRVQGQVPVEAEDRINRDAVATQVLLDWRHIADAEGKPLAYSHETSAKVVKSDHDFYDAVFAASIEEEHFRAQAIAEDAEALGNG